MADGRVGTTFGGGALTRKVSSSHVTPSSMLGYTNFFRQSSSREEGWLETQMGRGGVWQRKWVVFDDGALTLADSPDAAATSFVPANNNFSDVEYISSSSSNTSNTSSGSSGSSDGLMKVPMDHVISLRTDDQYGNTVIQIVTTEGKLLIRAESRDEMRRWLFCFQKSVALVLSKLLLQTPSSASSSSSVAGGGRGGTSAADDYDLSASRRGPSRALDCGAAGIGSHLWLATAPPPPGAPIIISGGSGGGPAVPGDKMWLAELGHGHGKHSYLARKRNSFVDRKSTPGSLMTRSLGDDAADAVLDAAARAPYSHGPGLTRGAGEGQGQGRGADPGGRVLTVQRSVLDLSSLDERKAGLQIDRRLMISGSGGDSRDKLQADDLSLDVLLLQPPGPGHAAAPPQAARSPAIPISALSASAAAEHAAQAALAARLARSYESGEGGGMLGRGGLGLTPRAQRLAPQTSYDDDDDETADGSDGGDGNDNGNDADTDMMFAFDAEPSPSPGGDSCGPLGPPPSLAAADDRRLRGFSTVSSVSNDSGGSPRRAAPTPVPLPLPLPLSVPPPPAPAPAVSPSHGRQQRSPSGAGGTRWCSGFCTKLGPRNSNEDRLVALPNLLDTLAAGPPPNASAAFGAKYQYQPHQHPANAPPGRQVTAPPSHP